jgi:class 3 adenylate cyclase
MDREELKSSLQGLGQDIRDIIAARLATSLDAEKLARLADMGIFDEASLRGLPADLTYEDAVRRFRDRITDMVAAAPSVLEQLGVRPLEILPAVADSDRDAQTIDLAVIFSDLQGFTAFTQQHGDASTRAMLVDHYEAVDAIVRSRGGRVLKTLGDGHMIRFDQAAASVAACVELVEASPGPLSLRVGAHFGPVIPIRDDLLGHVVNVASRIADLAVGGESLVTVELRDAAGKLPRFVFEPSRFEPVHGLDDAVEVCRVLRVV